MYLAVQKHIVNEQQLKIRQNYTIVLTGYVINVLMYCLLFFFQNQKNSVKLLGIEFNIKYHI